MIDNVPDTFEKFDDDFLEFDKIENKHSQRKDLHAFIMLDKLLPSKKDVIQGATRDEIWLEADLEELAKVATEDDIRDLVRCGVRWSDEADCLAMFA